MTTDQESTPHHEKREVGRATAVLAIFTLLSRLLGLVRNQILSHYFGASVSADAFIAAFTIPNALRRLFGEGALTPAFVSIFTRSIQEKGDWRGFFTSTFLWLTIILGALTLLGIVFAKPLVFLYVPHFRDTPGKFELTITLTRFLFPYLMLIAWSALFMGVLNSFKTFAISAAGPAISNLTIIIFTPLLLGFLFPETPYGIFIFGGSFLLGALFQTGANLPFLKRHGSLPSFKNINMWDPRLKELGILLIPATFSLGVHQLNIIVNRVFASRLDGAVSHLFYADLLVELPVSLIATSMSVAAVPSFTRLFIEKNEKGLSETFSFSIGLNALLFMPSTVGLLFLAGPIVSTIFLTGAFDLADTQITSKALVAYACGLPFFCALRSILPLYFATKDTRTPALIGIVALLVNLGAAWQLSRIFGTWGIATATSISSLVQFSLLFFLVRRRFPFFAWTKILRDLWPVLLASLAMGGFLYFARDLVDPSVWQIQGLSITKLLCLSALIGFSALIYFVLAYFLKIPVMRASVSELMRRFKKK